jgi:hypothetical protein
LGFQKSVKHLFHTADFDVSCTLSQDPKAVKNWRKIQWIPGARAGYARSACRMGSTQPQPTEFVSLVGN